MIRRHTISMITMPQLLRLLRKIQENATPQEDLHQWWAGRNLHYDFQAVRNRANAACCINYKGWPPHAWPLTFLIGQRTTLCLASLPSYSNQGLKRQATLAWLPHRYRDSFLRLAAISVSHRSPFSSSFCLSYSSSCTARSTITDQPNVNFCNNTCTHILPWLTQLP